MPHRRRSRAVAASALLTVLPVAAASAACSAQNASGPVTTATLTSTATSTGGTAVPGPGFGTATPTASPTPSDLPPTGSGRSLASVVLPSPAGYHLSDDPDADAGSLSQQDVETMLDGSGTIPGYQDGYAATYDQDAGDASVEVDLYRFGSDGDAAAFQFELAHAVVAGEQDGRPVSHGVAGLPGAQLVSPTVHDEKDGDEYTAVARRDAVVLVVDFLGDEVAATHAAQVSAAAASQYSRLADVGAGGIPGV